MKMADHFPPPSAYQNDLLSRVKRNHLQYICEENLKTKQRYREKLDSSIREILCVQNYFNVFNFEKSIEILRNNIQVPDFKDIFAVRDAWEAISTYASNLYKQPWRQEYSEISLYSGFYKHKIEPYLKGAEFLLRAIGYKRIGHKMIFELPINEDNLCKISLDALVAVCECQILSNVYEEVVKRMPSYSWLDILAFRERYPGTFEDTVHQIIIGCQLHSNQYIRCCHPTNILYPSNFHPACRNCSESASYKLKLSHGNGYCLNSPMNVPYQLKDNRVMYVNGYSFQPRVSTAKLIELDDPFESCGAYCKKTNVSPPSNYSRSGGDLLASSSLDEGCSRRNEKSRARSSKKSFDVFDKEKNKSDYGCRSSQFSKAAATKSKTITEVLNKLSLGSNTHKADCVDGSNIDDELIPRSPKSVVSNSKNENQWSCDNCTFYNSISRDVCEMCSKSRYARDETPLTRGGKQCNACTLVNRRGAYKCEACDANLENSSTYV